jgi:hypothetical protein
MPPFLEKFLPEQASLGVNSRSTRHQAADIQYTDPSKAPTATTTFIYQSTMLPTRLISQDSDFLDLPREIKV